MMQMRRYMVRGGEISQDGLKSYTASCDHKANDSNLVQLVRVAKASAIVELEDEKSCIFIEITEIK